MASSSSSDPDQSKKLSNLENSSPEANPPPEAASRSLEGYQQPPAPANASHQSHNPQAMGYPPVIGYPPGHPPPPYPHGYGPYQNYVSAPPPPPHGGYYPNPAYLPPVRQPRSSGFARGVLAAIIILIIISAVFSIVTYIIVRPKEPVFRLASFSVTNFNVSNAVLMGSWEARVMVDNPNEKLTTSFDQIQNLVYYKEPENYLAFSVQGPVSMSTKANTTITLMASTINGEQPKEWVVEEIEKERRGGVVNFGLGIRLMTTFKSSPWTLYQHIHVSCQDIKVAFGPGSSTGTLATSDKPKECNVYAT